MSETRQKYDDEFKQNVVRLSFASSRTAKEVADDLSISVSLLYRWLKQYTPAGEKTQFASIEEENRALKLELRAKMERDMLKKAAAYYQRVKHFMFELGLHSIHKCRRQRYQLYLHC